MFNVVVTPAALNCLLEIEFLKSLTMGAKDAAQYVDAMFDSSLAAVAEDPVRYRYNGLLADKGLLLRERLDIESDYRLIYDFDGETIEILLFVSMKQDLEKALYRYLITQ